MASSPNPSPSRGPSPSRTPTHPSSDHAEEQYDGGASHLAGAHSRLRRCASSFCLVRVRVKVRVRARVNPNPQPNPNPNRH